MTFNAKKQTAKHEWEILVTHPVSMTLLHTHHLQNCHAQFHSISKYMTKCLDFFLIKVANVKYNQYY